VSAVQKLASDPPPRQIFPPDRLDDVAEAVIALTRELWVVIDRMTVMEKVMEANGIDLAKQIDAYRPDEATQAKLDAMRAKLLETVLTALKADIER
jgi:hypothetical protein